MKFLIDECLSPDLATDARKRGFLESVHVTWLGLGATADWVIVRRAVQDGYVLVTNNTIDFTRLVEREAIHSGLICLNVTHEFMSLVVQKRLFSLALDHLAQDEPINDVLEITMTRDKRVQVRRWASSGL
ncbi:MAG: DUF5615 family PIN-like protein [Deltaproteobacteria bacterium]|nr:DUF5615 family PIN-like protein [Deltaproteobacteria bacterium]